MKIKIVFKVLVVLIVGYLLWVGFSGAPKRSPLEKKVEHELYQAQTPDRYSDGSWSVHGLLAKTDIKEGDAFMVRGVVQIAANLNSDPNSWYVQLADTRAGSQFITILIKPEEAPIFNEDGMRAVVQIRAVKKAGTLSFETF